MFNEFAGGFNTRMRHYLDEREGNVHRSGMCTTLIMFLDNGNLIYYENKVYSTVCK